MIHHIKRATRHLIFWSLIAAAIGLTGVRLLLLGIEHYKSDLATNISALVGTPVTIGRLGAKMRGFNPELVLKDIAISSRTVPARPPSGVTHANPLRAGLSSAASTGNEKPAIQFNEMRLGIDLLDMLVSRDLLSSSWVTLVGAKLSIKRQQDGSIVIVGLKASGGQPQWLLQGGKYEVLQSEITWQDEISNARPLLFNEVDLAISNKGEHHRLNMLMKLPKKVGNTLRISMDFKGNVFEPSTIQGRVYIDGQAVLLPELVALGQTSVGDRIHINAGTGDFKIWGDWRQSQLMSMDVEAQIQQMALVRQDKQEFSVKQLRTRFHWRLNDASNQWQLDVNDFSLETQDNPKGVVKKWPAAAFSVSGQRMDDTALHKLALYVERVDLQEASELAQFFAPLPDEQVNTLAQARLQGTLENFSLFADPDAKEIALNGRFAKIGVGPLSSVPGIENLTGQIKGSEKQGVITLATKDARLIAPDLFREVLPVKRLQGRLDWQQAENAWSVSSPMIELDSLSFQSKTRFRIDVPKTGGPVFMDMQSAFAGEDASEVKHYLPVGIMDEEVVAWLDRAFVGGSMTNGGLLVYGNLNDFPFSSAPGVFEAVFNGEQFDLSYAPEWPHITGMNAEVLFSQDSLKVNVRQGKSGNVIIKQAEVTVPKLNKSKYLLIQGEAESGIDQVLAFMQQTPLSSPVDSLLEAITPLGNTQVRLDLKIPLVDGAPTKVDGAAQLKDAKLSVKSLALSVSKINGELKFNEQGVYSDTIHAVALGNPIQINIKSSESRTTVNVEGRAGISDLQTQFDMPWWEIASGATDYRLKLELPYGNAAPELVVESMLSGVSLDLPESLAKTREQKIPLSLTFNLGDKQLLPVLLNYDNKLKAAIQLDTRQKTIYSGHILVGAGEVAQIQDAGLKLEINRGRLALQDWLGLAVAQGAGVGGRIGSFGNCSMRYSTSCIHAVVPIAALPPSTAVVRELKIHSDHALWNKTDIGVFDLALKHNGNFWAGAIASSFAKGSIQIPADFKNTDRISLDMELLDLSALKQMEWKDSSPAVSAPLLSGASRANPLQTLSPELVPLLTVTSQKTLWRSINLGRLSLETKRIPGGMGFKDVELAGENQKLVLSGDWQISGKQSVTHARGHLEVPRAGQLLAQLGITKDLTGTSAAVDFAIEWGAAPYQFSLADLNGQMDINLKNGRILSIEPGFGRLLGMLALAQWIKRAQLDFSDIYEEGLTFNSIKGHFDLAGGIASTHNLIVDAVPAKIAISGDTDLVSQTIDHIINVTPKSADAVPIAGTIIGKVAALVGRSLTGKDQEGFFFGSQYLVKGAWGKAEIIPMHKNDGLLQKTWNGITDFPWVRQQEETTQQLEK
ncbi:MAG: YhdP family protein [Methylobacter sp.]|nr:YhdP family protein [Methylobacter sp.]